MRKLVLALTLVWVLPGVAAAAGFAVASQGAGALGVAGSATARLDLPEIGFYNPAAWGRLDGFQGSVGATAVAASISHQSTAGISTAADTPVSVPPYLYAAYGFDTGAGQLAIGVAGGVPFGSGVAWPTDWSGRFEITEIRLQVYEGAAIVAYSPTFIEGFSVAAGLRYLGSSVELWRQVDAVSSEGSAHIGGQTSGVGALLALAYQPFPEASFGATYRSRVQLDFAGAVHFEGIPVELASAAHDGAVHTSLTLPDRLAFGGAYHLGKGSVSADLEVTLWSTFQELAIDMEDPATPDVQQPRNWRDTLALRVGYEHRDLLLDGLLLRAGFAWDQAPSPTDTLSPTSPDANRVLLTAGVGYNLFNWGLGVHLSYAHVFFLGAEATGSEAFPGSYDASAELFAFGLAYRTPAE